MLRVGLGLTVGINPQCSHQVSMIANMSIHATINNSLGITGMWVTGISQTQGKCIWEIS